MAFFVSFEGGEGTGKSSQAEVLTTRLKNAGVQVMPVHEPGMTRLGEYLRVWLKREHTETISPMAELLMFAAARAELVTKILKPVLHHNKLVIVADRYADSTIAYQSYGRRLPLQKVDAINRLATHGVMPNITFLLDCPPNEGLNRTGSAQATMPMDSGIRTDVGRIDTAGTRRFEEEALEFHNRVRDGYLKLAKKEPDRWQVMDATKPMEETSEIVWSCVQTELSALDLNKSDQYPTPDLWT